MKNKDIILTEQFQKPIQKSYYTETKSIFFLYLRDNILQTGIVPTNVSILSVLLQANYKDDVSDQVDECFDCHNEKVGDAEYGWKYLPCN